MYTEKIGYVEAIALIDVVMINKIILNTPKDIIVNTRLFSLAQRNIYIISFYFRSVSNFTPFKEISWS